MQSVLHFCLAIAVIFALALLVSYDRKQIKTRYIIQLVVIEVLLAWFLLNSKAGVVAVSSFAGLFDELMKFAGQGSDFVFGNMSKRKAWLMCS